MKAQNVIRIGKQSTYFYDFQELIDVQNFEQYILSYLAQCGFAASKHAICAWTYWQPVL